MTDQLQLRDWQQMCQAKAAHYAGTPDADDYLAESKRYGMAADRIEELSAMLDHQRNEAMESDRLYLAEFAKLRAELAQAKLYMPGRRAEAMPKTENGPCNYPYWRILEVTA